MSALIGSLWPYLAAAGGALLVLWRIWAGGKKTGVLEQKAKEAEARNENIKRLKAAIDAGNQHPLGGVSDKHDRDNR